MRTSQVQMRQYQVRDHQLQLAQWKKWFAGSLIEKWSLLLLDKKEIGHHQQKQ